MTAMKRAIAYLRVSTAGQADDGVSLDAQRAKVESWCHVNDLTLSTVFVDSGISGKRADNRPELQAALAAAMSAAGVLVVYSLSRLARSTKDTILIAEQLERAGCDLVSLTEKIDTTNAAGKMVFRMLAVLAEFERDLVSERTRAALSHKKSLGQRVGQIPYGYDVGGDGSLLIPDRREQASLQLISLLRDSGHSYASIADVLNRKSIPTKQYGAEWHSMTVRRIICRPAT
jgi:DNA invertase Pin-like site-specific DNA recombinase